MRRDLSIVNEDGTEHKWWDDPETWLAVLEYGIEMGEFSTATDAARFFERPNKWGDLYLAYDEDHIRQGEYQDERKAIL